MVGSAAAAAAAAPWRLLHILPGHTADAKAVACSSLTTGLSHSADGGSGSTQQQTHGGQGKHEGVELIHSASRDETARSWYRDWSATSTAKGADPLSAFCPAATYRGQRYQNAVAHWHGDGSGRGNGMTVMGGLDARILVFQTSSASSEKPRTVPVQVLQDHFDNVCHLSIAEAGRAGPRDDEEVPLPGTVALNQSTLLISASWDCTSRVWSWQKREQEWQPLHLLKGHERAVWSAEVVSNVSGDESYLTASADLFVRLFRGETMTRVFAGHTDVVRSITLLPPLDSGNQAAETDEAGDASMTSTSPGFFKEEQLFGTCSNDGSLRIWSLDDRRCPPHNPSSGGDALRVLSPGDGNADLLYDACFAGLHVPAVPRSDTLGQHHRLVATCGEDGIVRGWDIDGAAVAFEIPQPVTSVWSISMLPLSGDLVTANSDSLVRVFTRRPRKAARSQHDPKAIGEVSDQDLDRHAELCQHVANSKRKSRVRAEIVAREANELSASQGETTGPALDDHQQYDAVLKIDVSDDAEPLSLPINRGDHPRARAKEFIERYDLPAVYEDQIVAFIDQVGPK